MLDTTQSVPEVASKEAAGLEVSVYRGGVEAVEQVAAEWSALSQRASNNEPFYRPEWAKAHIRAFTKHQEVLVYAARRNGELAGVLPMVRDRVSISRLPVRRLRPAFNVHSCRFDLLRAAGPDGEAAIPAIWEELKATPGWDLLEFFDVPEGAALDRLHEIASSEGFATAAEGTLESPCFPLEAWQGDWDWWLLRLKAKFRQNVRRRKKKLEERGPVRLERLEIADRKALQEFYEIENSGWKGAEGTAIAGDAATRQFYDEITAAAAREGYLTLYFLEANGQRIAGHLGLSYAGRYFVPKLAYREEFDQYSPGQLLVNAVARDCAERGLTEFDFVGQMMDWKSEWTSNFRQHRVLYIWARGVYGSLLNFARFSLPNRIKQALGRGE